MKEDRRTHAHESVTPRFSRMMTATVSPYGMLTDLPIISLATAATSTVALGIGVQLEAGMSLVAGLIGFALVPVFLGAGVSFSLRGARTQVVDWMAGLPFPMENMNGLLEGVADKLRIRFEESRPSGEELNEALDAVSPDCFVMEFEGEADLLVDVKIGVLDSKYNPARANHRRYCRVQQIVEQILVPVSEKHVIQDVWIA